MNAVQRTLILVSFLVMLCTSCDTPFPSRTASWQNPASKDLVLAEMPRCAGLTDLRAPLKFDWLDIATALEKLADYQWGYYTCAISQPTLAAFLQEHMNKPPYRWREVNHANDRGGRVTLYFQPDLETFMYIWTLPKPDTQTSYMVVARGDPGMPQTWECRLPLLENQKVSLK